MQQHTGSEGDQVIAYLEQQRQAQRQRKNVQSLITVATIAVIGIICYVSADLQTSLGWGLAAFFAGALILGAYRARH